MSLRVLVADENLAVQRLIEITLRKDDIEVTCSDNGLSALDLALQRTPDIILADYNLEGLDVFSFVRKVRQKDRLSDVPIILLISATEQVDPAELQSAGIQNSFKKPLDAAILLEEIKRLTGTAVQSSETSLSQSGDSDLSEHFPESEGENQQMGDMLGWSANEGTQDSTKDTATMRIPSEASGDPAAITDAIHAQVKESIEKITWDVLPDLLRSVLSKENMAPILEKVAWEVVGPMAELQIKKEIERLQAEVKP